MNLTHPDDWYKDWRWIAAAAATLVAVAVLLMAISLSQQGPVLDRLDGIAADNHATLESLERQGAGVQVLVDYVEELRAREGQGTETAQRFVDLLCADSDPMRIAACQEFRRQP